MVFQFTPLREGRLNMEVTNNECIYFNSRPSARGDLFQRLHLFLCRFQFTPLREGRLSVKEIAELWGISIHAPPRGATNIRAGCTSSASAFQFTPLREGRPQQRRNHQQPSIFQFTPLREGRPYWEPKSHRIYFISIHAPPRGATALKLVALRTF